MFWLRWTIGAVLLFFSILAAYINAAIWIQYILTKKTASSIPIIGAAAGVIALLTIPVRGIRNWWWAPPIADVTCLLGIAYLIGRHLSQCFRRKRFCATCGIVSAAEQSPRRKLGNGFMSITNADQIQKNNWPYSDPPNASVFSTRSVIFDRLPIRYVHHKESDGAWHFYASSDVNLAEAVNISLAHVAIIDPSVTLLVDLTCGWFTYRPEPTAEWQCAQDAD